MSIIGRWNSHVVTDDLVIAERISTFEIERVNSGGVDGYYNGNPMTVTYGNDKILRLEVASAGFGYAGRVLFDSIILVPPGRRKKHRPPFVDGEDGTWTAEKTGGSGGDTDRKKKKKSGAALRKRKAATKKR